MTTDTDHTHELAEEIAELRRELAETRRELAHVIASMKRQDDSQRQLRRDLDQYLIRPNVRADDAFRTTDADKQTTDHASPPRDEKSTPAPLAERVGKLEFEVEKLRFFGELTNSEVTDASLGILRVERETGEHVAWIEGYLRELEVWVQALAERAFPKAHRFAYSELFRIFPNGFADVPSRLLPKKMPPKRG